MIRWPVRFSIEEPTNISIYKVFGFFWGGGLASFLQRVSSNLSVYFLEQKLSGLVGFWMLKR